MYEVTCLLSSHPHITFDWARRFYGREDCDRVHALKCSCSARDSITHFPIYIFRDVTFFSFFFNFIQSLNAWPRVVSEVGVHMPRRINKLFSRTFSKLNHSSYDGCFLHRLNGISTCAVQLHPHNNNNHLNFRSVIMHRQWAVTNADGTCWRAKQHRQIFSEIGRYWPEVDCCSIGRSAAVWRPPSWPSPFIHPAPCPSAGRTYAGKIGGNRFSHKNGAFPMLTRNSRQKKRAEINFKLSAGWKNRTSRF